MKIFLLCLLLPVMAHAQWPGYFYAFTLTDESGNLINLKNNNYTFTILKPAKNDMILEMLMCSDSETLRFYAGGNHGLGDLHQLEVLNKNSKEKMTIVFPSSFSGGENKFYRNLFAGAIKFKKGIYKIQLPVTDSAWNNLTEKHFCPDYGGNDSYWDIGSFQKQ